MIFDTKPRVADQCVPYNRRFRSFWKQLVTSNEWQRFFPAPWFARNASTDTCTIYLYVSTFCHFIALNSCDYVSPPVRQYGYDDRILFYIQMPQSTVARNHKEKVLKTDLVGHYQQLFLRSLTLASDPERLTQLSDSHEFVWGDQRCKSKHGIPSSQAHWSGTTLVCKNVSTRFPQVISPFDFKTIRRSTEQSQSMKRLTYEANLMQNWVKYFRDEQRLSRMTGRFVFKWPMIALT